MPKTAEEIVARTVAPLAAVDVPAALARSIVCHRQNLIDLAKAMLAGGMPVASVETSLETMFSSYRIELTAVIAELQEERNARRP